jgi:hypothetical protein
MDAMGNNVKCNSAKNTHLDIHSSFVCLSLFQGLYKQQTTYGETDVSGRKIVFLIVNTFEFIFFFALIIIIFIYL